MTVTSTKDRAVFAGTGSTGPFTTDIIILAESHLDAKTVIDSTGVQTSLTLTTDYTVNTALTQITTLVAIPTGTTLVVVRNVPKTQASDYLPAGVFPAETLEDDLDKNIMLHQQFGEVLDRTLVVPTTVVSGFSTILPTAVDKGGRYLKLNSGATGFEYDSISTTGILNMVEDTSPQLGGDLATNGNDILVEEDDVLIFEGATDDAFETTLTTIDPTADRVVSLPNATDTLVGKATTDTLTNKTLTSATLTTPTLTSAVLNTAVSGTAVLDEDTLSSDSNTQLATQQSIKAYVDAATGIIVQQVNVQTGAVATGTTVLPYNDTIPQNTEGTEFMTLAITPTNSSNILVIEASSVSAQSGAAVAPAMALFQDTTADALAAVWNGHDAIANHLESLSLRHHMTAGTTSATTFKIRMGGIAAGTFTFNGQSAGRIFGGVAASSITITEIEV